MRFFIVLFIAILISGRAYSAIRPEHRTCLNDQDCALIMISCAECCPKPADFEAINKGHLKEYENPGICTPEHIRDCGVPECGLFVPEPYPMAVCESGICAVKVHPADPRPQPPAPAPQPALASNPSVATLPAKDKDGLTAADREMVARARNQLKSEERSRAIEEAEFRRRDRNRALFFAGVFLLLSGRAITIKKSTRKLAHFWLVINGLTAFFVGGLCLNALFFGSLFFDDPHASYKKFLIGWGLPLLISIVSYLSAQNKFSREEYLQSVRLSLSFVAFVNILIIVFVLSP